MMATMSSWTARVEKPVVSLPMSPPLIYREFQKLVVNITKNGNRHHQGRAPTKKVVTRTYCVLAHELF
jgi:hypothetical protein